MSAPWLILPFAFGYTQRRPGRAALVALVATASALAGYFALTLSPIEGVAPSSIPTGLPGLLGSNLENIVGGAITAPLCGLIGQRARAGRWWPAPSSSRARSASSRSPATRPGGSTRPASCGRPRSGWDRRRGVGRDHGGGEPPRPRPALSAAASSTSRFGATTA